MVVPIEKGPNSVILATCDLLSPTTMDELMFVLSQDVALLLARAGLTALPILQGRVDTVEQISHPVGAQVDVVARAVEGGVGSELAHPGLDQQDLDAVAVDRGERFRSVVVLDHREAEHIDVIRGGPADVGRHSVSAEKDDRAGRHGADVGDEFIDLRGP